MASKPRHPSSSSSAPWLAADIHLFDALGHPVRRYIADIVARREEPSGALAEMVQHRFGIGWSTVSHHLKVLHRAGLVRVRAVPPERLYRLDDDAVPRLDALLTGLQVKWASREGAGYHTRLEPAEAVWPTRRALRRPVDDDEAIQRLLDEVDREKADAGLSDTNAE